MIDEQRLLDVIDHLRRAIGFLTVHNPQAASRHLTETYEHFRVLRDGIDKPPKGE